MCILQTSAECELYILDTFSARLHKNGPLLQPHNNWCHITWIWLHPVSHDCYWALVMLLKPASGGRVLLVLVGCFIQFLPSIYFLHIYIAVRYFMWRGARLSLHLHLLHRPGWIITDIGLINCFADQQQTFLQPDTSYKLSYLETLSSFWSAPTQPHHSTLPALPMNGNIQYPSPDLWTLSSSSLIMPFH